MLAAGIILAATEKASGDITTTLLVPSIPTVMLLPAESIATLLFPLLILATDVIIPDN